MSHSVKPTLLRWARERAGLDVASLTKKYPKYAQWESGEAQPTWRQLQDFAHRTATPFGYFFLDEPPEERLPIHDFRTVGDRPVAAPSPALLDTVQAMEQRQEWLRETLIDEEADPVAYAGSVTLSDAPAGVAERMLAAAGLREDWARGVATWQEAVSVLRRAIEDSGTMAVVNGVVGNNTHRPLDVDEFRGFALADAHAPLIFVNGADAKSAQMFTLIHEWAHIWLGRGGVSGIEALVAENDEVERFCNKVAAAFLVPERRFREAWRETADPILTAKRFKVSPVVAARRALDLGLLDREAFFAFYRDYQQTERTTAKKRSGGDFYRNQDYRVGERFAHEVVRAAKEGRLLYRDAYRLTGLHGTTFERYASHLGYAP